MEKEKSIAVMKDSCDRAKVERNDYDRTSIYYVQKISSTNSKAKIFNQRIQEENSQRAMQHSLKAISTRQNEISAKEKSFTMSWSVASGELSCFLRFNACCTRMCVKSKTFWTVKYTYTAMQT